MRARMAIAWATVALVTFAVAGCTSGRSSSHAPSSTSSHAPSRSSADAAVSLPARLHSTAQSKVRTVTVLGSGDVLIHPPLWQQANSDARAEHRSGYDFRPMYASIAPDVKRADLAVCEMESPLARPGGPFSGWPQFNSPPQVLTALRAVGYDSCTTASNHSIDQGYIGVKRTLDELDAAGLRHTGSARSAAEAATPLIVTMPNGVRVAQLAYAFGFNGLTRPAGERWLANLTSIPDILAAARRAKRAGADIVVLSMHWGIEYNLAATAEQIAQAHRLLASPDIDLILGDHPHVVEPAEQINHKWVVYSMGNQISRHADPLLVSREGAMPLFTFTEIKPGRFQVTHAEIIATLLRMTPKLRLIDLPRALDDPATSAADRGAYRSSVADVRKVLDSMGAARNGLIVD